MKRIGNLYGKICSLENLRMADAIAREGKKDQYGVILHDRNREENILELREALLKKEFSTSPYKQFKIHDPKPRDISCLPYYPDRILHHDIMLVLEPMFVSVFTADTYSCIKGRGIHAAKNAIEKALRDRPGTEYCLQLDIKKFYPSIDHDILKTQLRRKIKDPDLLWLLDDIIDSAPGVPIGNYLSQFFANFNMAPFDHWIKETMRVKNYFRYSDDMIIFSGSKPYLHELLAAIREYLWCKLKLHLKGNYQVFPVDAQGVDMIGYRFYHGHTLIRKTIKQNFCRAVARGKGIQTIAAYWGWAKHCNSNHLIKKLFNQSV
jgi:retron-type reverse transcriptase